METENDLIDPENEVKKLQELVKKLEKQNELLRNKQKLSLDSHSLPNGDVEKSALSQNNNQQNVDSPSYSVKERANEEALEEFDVLDVDNLSLKDEEDSWLYSSPKPPTPQQTNINLYKWVRQDFDHPSPEVESARRSLLSKLDEAARMNRSSSSPSLGPSSSPTKPASALSRSTEEAPKANSRPQHKQSLLAMTGNRIDNGTFTRAKKPRERSGPVVPERDQLDSEVYHTMEGTDVETLAKQQEESLRQSMATYTSPKRVLYNKSMSVASDTDNSGSPIGSNRSSPARYDLEGNYIGRHRNSFGSDNGTPPDSPRTLQQHSTPYSDVFGCVDGTHVRISAPSDGTEGATLTGKISIQLTCRWPGSVHDARILRTSRLFADFELNNPPVQGVILGDSAYMSRWWLMTPLVNPVTRPERRYNFAQSSTRTTVERSIGVLKQRWRCLRVGLDLEPRKAAKVILVCCMLHNRARRLRLPFDDQDLDLEVEDRPPRPQMNANERARVALGQAVRRRIITDFFTQ